MSSEKQSELLVWSLAVIWQTDVIKSGQAIASLYLEKLFLSSKRTKAAISVSDDCQLLTWLCITHPSWLCLYRFLRWESLAYLSIMSPTDNADRRGSLGSGRCFLPSGDWLDAICCFRIGLFFKVSLLPHTDSTKNMRNAWQPGTRCNHTRTRIETTLR